MSNPYASPAPEKTETQQAGESNLIATVGFYMSLTGVLALFGVGPFGSLLATVCMCVAFVSLPGLLISIVGLFRRPRRLAEWGVVLGTFGSFYLPTFYLSLFLLI